MNRSFLREIAIHIILDVDYTGDDPNSVIDERLEKNYYATLAADNEIYTDYPGEKDIAYLRASVTGVYLHRDELDSVIERYSIDWKVSRISRITRAVLRLAVFEIKYADDIPDGVAVNEAVKLTKKYDSEQAGSFVNGILGSYLRSGEK